MRRGISPSLPRAPVAGAAMWTRPWCACLYTRVAQVPEGSRLSPAMFARGPVRSLRRAGSARRLRGGTSWPVPADPYEPAEQSVTERAQRAHAASGQDRTRAHGALHRLQDIGRRPRGTPNAPHTVASARDASCARAGVSPADVCSGTFLRPREMSEKLHVLQPSWSGMCAASASAHRGPPERLPRATTGHGHLGFQQQRTSHAVAATGRVLRRRRRDPDHPRAAPPVPRT